VRLRSPDNIVAEIKEVIAENQPDQDLRPGNGYDRANKNWLWNYAVCWKI